MARASTTRGHGKAGLVKGWSCISCVFIPISLRYFPPLRRGARGGGPGTTSHKVFPMLSPSQSFRIPLARREESFLISKAIASPPLTPPSQGGERDRSLATSFHRAQQKHASRYHAGPSPPQPVQSETGEERADWTSPGGGLSGCRGRCWVGGSGIVRDRIGHGATTGRIGRIRGLLDGRQGGIGHAQERSGIFLPAFARAPVPRSSRRCGGCIARRSQVGSARIGKRRPRGSVRLRGLRPIAGRGTRPGRVGLGNIERRGLCSRWRRVAPCRGVPTSRCRSSRRRACAAIRLVHLEGRPLGIRWRVRDRWLAARACRTWHFLPFAFRRGRLGSFDRILLQLLFGVGTLGAGQGPVVRELSPPGRKVPVVLISVKFVDGFLVRARCPFPANRVQGEHPALLGLGQP